jgi:hypothetical protein
VLSVVEALFFDHAQHDIWGEIIMLPKNSY